MNERTGYSRTRQFRRSLRDFAIRWKVSMPAFCSISIIQLSKRGLRSGLSGYQYYKAGMEGHLTRDGVYRKRYGFRFVYSSACPCSAELAEHARDIRDAYSIPHSQRSKARIWVTLADSTGGLSFEEIQEHCQDALKTETQVMVKREDEQAFAELNGVYQIRRGCGSRHFQASQCGTSDRGFSDRLFPSGILALARCGVGDLQGSRWRVSGRFHRFQRSSLLAFASYLAYCISQM